MPKPPTRQTPTPRYRVMAEHVQGEWWYFVCEREPAQALCRARLYSDAKLICRALNASRSKGKP